MAPWTGFRLSRQAKSRHTHTRERAIERLVASGDFAAIKCLAVAATHKDPAVSTAAKEALIRSGSRALDPLVAMSKRVLRRMEAAESMTGIARRLGFRRPLLSLKDSLNRLAWVVIDLLREIRDPRAAEALIPFLSAPHDPQDWLRGHTRDALVRVGPPAVEGLVTALRNKDWRVRCAAAIALKDIGDARAVEPLLGALKDQMWEVRDVVARALGTIGDARAVEGLVEALRVNSHYGSDNAREAAAEALGKIGDARAVGPLIAILDDEEVGLREPHVQRAAWKALAEIGTPQALLRLVAVSEGGYFQKDAANVLAKIRGKAVQTLVAALGNNDWRMRAEAAEALGKIGGVQALDPLIEALKDEVLHVYRAATNALIQIGEPAVKALAAALKDKDNDSGVRKAAAKALGEIGDARPVQSLKAALEDADRGVRSEAAEALAKIESAGAKAWEILTGEAAARQAAELRIIDSAEPVNEMRHSLFGIY